MLNHIIPLGTKWNIIIHYKLKTPLLVEHEHQDKDLVVKEIEDIPSKHKNMPSKDNIVITKEKEATSSSKKIPSSQKSKV